MPLPSTKAPLPTESWTATASEIPSEITETEDQVPSEIPEAKEQVSSEIPSTIESMPSEIPDEGDQAPSEIPSDIPEDSSSGTIIEKDVPKRGIEDNSVLMPSKIPEFVTAPVTDIPDFLPSEIPEPTEHEEVVPLRTTKAFDTTELTPTEVALDLVYPIDAFNVTDIVIVINKVANVTDIVINRNEIIPSEEDMEITEAVPIEETHMDPSDISDIEEVPSGIAFRTSSSLEPSDIPTATNRFSTEDADAIKAVYNDAILFLAADDATKIADGTDTTNATEIPKTIENTNAIATETANSTEIDSVKGTVSTVVDPEDDEVYLSDSDTSSRTQSDNLELSAPQDIKPYVIEPVSTIPLSCYACGRYNLTAGENCRSIKV